MRELVFRGVMEAPADVIFRLASDANLIPEYLTQVTRVWDVDGDGTHIGDSFRFEEHLLGRRVEGKTEITDVDVPFGGTNVTRYDNGLVVTWRSRLTPQADGWTATEDVISYEPGPGLLGELADTLLLHRVVEGHLRDGLGRFEALVAREMKARKREPATAR